MGLILGIWGYTYLFEFIIPKNNKKLTQITLRLYKFHQTLSGYGFQNSLDN